MVHSGDDFTLMPQSGRTTSTMTIVNYNEETLWDQVKPENQIVEDTRATVAKRLAMFGHEWTEFFSGWKNKNQRVVINYKLFNSGDVNEIQDTMIYIYMIYKQSEISNKSTKYRK